MTGTGKGVIERGRGAAARGILAAAVVVGTVLSAVAPTMAQQAPPAGGAGAAVVQSPPTIGEVISFPQRDFVVVDGFPARTAATITVLRPDAVDGDDVVIGTATGTTDETGFVEINHAGSDCWIGVTPDILPGDKVRVSMAGQDDQETTTANVTADRPVIEGGVLTIHGTAQDAAGRPLPIAQIEQRLVNPDLVTGGNARTLRADATGQADGTLTYDAAGSIAWTARYPNAGRDHAAPQRVATESRAMWLGRNPGAAVGAELTIYENPGEPGPAPGCAAPFAQTAITDLSLSALNIANQGQPLVVSGVAVAQATQVVVSVADGQRGTGEQTIDLPVTDAQKAWTATVPAAELDALADGRYQVTARFTGRGVRTTDTAPILKDTVAPDAPTADPVAGSFAADQLVTLAAERGATIRFTQNGSNPTARSRAYRQTIHVTADQTIAAKAWDQADNPGAAATFAYAIAGAADPTGPVAQPGDEQPVDQGPGRDVAPTAPLAIVTFPERDFVSIEGLAPRTEVGLQVLRGGAVIGTSGGAADGAGLFEVNHPGGECWMRNTPDIAAGDVIRLSVQGDADAYVTTVANVTVSAADPTVERNEAGAPVRIEVHGTAQDADGRRLPLDQLEHRFVGSSANPFQGTVNKRTMRASAAGEDGTLRYDNPNDPTSITWTATYEGASANAANVDLIAAGVESRVMWLGTDPAAGTDLTIFEHPGEPGPTAGCNAPFAQTAITGTNHQAINLATVGQDLVVTGVAAEGTERVVVSLDGGTTSQDVGPLGAPGRNGQLTWTVTFPSGQVAAQADGQVAITAQFFTAGNESPASDTVMLLKDTEAPRKPTATPPGGAYAQGQTVALETDDGTIRYTQDGSAPTRKSRLFSDEIRVGASQTIKARVFDDAGNSSPIASFVYEIGQADAAAVTAITGFDRAHTVPGFNLPVVNIANANQDLVVSGTVAAGVTEVSVSVAGGGPSLATLTPGRTRFADQSWEATIAAVDLKKLPQGRATVTVQFTGGNLAAAEATQTAALLKDTVAPAKPTGTPKPGNSTAPRNVRLNAAGATKIVYATGAGPLRQTYAGAIRINRTTTIRAQAVDAVGNTSPVATLKYTIRRR